MADSSVSPPAPKGPVKEVGTFEAKTHLSRILDEVERGTTYIITRHGKRVAEVRALSGDSDKPLPRFGVGRGSVRYMAEDFDAPLEDFNDYM